MQLCYSETLTVIESQGKCNAFLSVLKVAFYHKEIFCPRQIFFLYEILREPTTGINPTFSAYFRFFFFILKMNQYVCRELCENFRQIGQKMNKL